MSVRESLAKKEIYVTQFLAGYTFQTFYKKLKALLKTNDIYLQYRSTLSIDKAHQDEHQILVNAKNKIRLSRVDVNLQIMFAKD